MVLRTAAEGDATRLRELARALDEGVVRATCSACGAEAVVEPDAEGYGCEACGGEGTVSSPILALICGAAAARRPGEGT